MIYRSRTLRKSVYFVCYSFSPFINFSLTNKNGYRSIPLHPPAQKYIAFLDIIALFLLGFSELTNKISR